MKCSQWFRKLKKVAAAIVCLSLSSCVTLKTPRRTNLIPLKTPQLIGKYPVLKTKKYLRDSTWISYQDITWYYFKSSPGSDSVELKEATHMELELTDSKHITSRMYKDRTLLKSGIIKGRLKNGYFRKKARFTMEGIPPFYWSTTSIKVQFGIGTEQQLFIDHAQETNGSILIIMAGTPGITTSDTIQPYIKK